MAEKKVAMPNAAPGTHVSTRSIYNRDITYTWWEPEFQYAWALGPAMSKFLLGLKDGKILGRKCRKCDRVLVPPRMFCDWCYGPTDEWIELPDTGIIETFSIAYLDADARRVKEPILMGVIDIDGANEHHGFMHFFGGCKPEKLKIGMKVQAVWKPKKEREGSIRDILYFKPYRPPKKKKAPAKKKKGGKKK
jgi:uncharacterized OB-fold protein